MYYKSIILATTLTLTLGGCAGMTETQQGAGQGALLGASAGAIIGVLAGDGKGAAIGAGVGAGVGAAAGYAWSQRMEEQKRQMEASTAGTNIRVSRTADNRLKVDIPSDHSFDTGRAEIKNNMRPVLDSFAASMMQNSSTMIIIVGHTDDSGNDAINNPLSVDRAASTRDYLAWKGVPQNRFSIEGRGSYEPVVANTSPSNRARNRRVEIFVFEQ